MGRVVWVGALLTYDERREGGWFFGGLFLCVFFIGARGFCLTASVLEGGVFVL